MSDDSLERLKKRLYKEGEGFGGRFEEPELPYRPEKVEPGWKEPEEPEEILAEVLKESRFKNMKIFIWGSVIFVLGLAVLAAVYLFGGFGAVSERNIEIVISAPEEVAGGELVRWEVSVQNNNDVRLASADLAFKYPDGSRPVNTLQGTFLIERVSLGDVPAKGIARHTFAANVFGSEGEEKEAEVFLEYRTEGSNAIFEKVNKTKVKIIRSPLGVSISAPQEINAGREISFSVNYISNSEETTRGLVLDLVYPEGFLFKNSNPAPVEGQSRWNLGDLAPGEARTVNISGVFEGEEMEQKSIVARVGVLEGRDIAVYGASTHPFTLRRMFVELLAIVNNRPDIQSVRAGDFLNVDLSWRNNLLQSVRNASIEVLLEGEAIDEGSVAVSSGSYRGADKKAVWSPSSLRDLALLNPGSQGQTRLALRLLDAVSISRSGLKNPVIKISGEIKPGVKPEGLESADVSGRFELELKLETELQVSSRGFYNLTSLPGSGPLPPRVGQETVYAVVWSLASPINNTSAVEVRASLPAYVRWKGVVSPAGETIIYDPVTSEIVWRPGRIEAGVGISQPAREVSFRLGFIPSASQVGTSPVLLFDITAMGRDDWTGGELRDTEPSLTTDVSRFDSAMKQGDGTVAQ